MSGAQVSSFPSQNILFEAASGQALQRGQRNALLMEQDRQTLGANEMEYMARGSQSLLALGDEAKMAEQYPLVVGELQRLGFAKNAPAQFPGVAALQRIASMGTPSEKQGEQRVNLAGNAALVSPYTGSRPGATTAAPITTPVPGATPGAPVEVPPELMPFYQKASAETGIPVDVLIAQHKQESGFNPKARGSAGEIGLGQIKPSTAKDPGFGMTGIDPATLEDPETNIMFSARYLRARGGDADFTTPAGRAAALRSYNGGGDPNYVANVTRYLPQQPAPVTPEGRRVQVASLTNPTVATDATTAPAPGVTPPVPGQQQTAAATPAPQQQPATDPAVPPPGRRFRPDQEADLQALAADPKTPRTQIVATMAKYDDDNRIARENALTRQRQTEQDQAVAAERARVARRDQAKEDREVAAAGKPIPGDSVNAVNRNILIAGDPASPEYASAYADYSAQKTESGTVFRPDMSMYREPTWKPPGGTGAGGRSYGTPETKDVPTAGDKSKLKEIETQGSSILAALETFRKTRTEAGGIERIATAMGVPTELATTYGNAALLAKGVALYELGVLNGPDLEILQRVLADPSTVSGGLVSSETVNKQVDQVKTLLETKIGKAREQYGGAKPEAAAASPAVPKIEPPPAPGGAKITVKTAEDYAKVPAGAEYTAPDGSVRRKAK